MNGCDPLPYDPDVQDWLSGRGRAIPLFRVFMPDRVIDRLRHVLQCGYIGEGPRVEAFEQRLGAWFDNDQVLALHTGTAALQLALRLSGVQPGDEVISTPVTCVATNQAILAAGAKVVWADVDPWTGTLDPEDVERKIGPRTRAVVCVHWGGYPCELDELNAVAGRHGVKLIEDACHAFGSTYRGRKIGSHSDFACFSFQAVKMVTTVDGGALTCRSRSDVELGRLLRWYGIDRKRNHRDHGGAADIRHVGTKLHMNDVTAAIGLEQLEHAGENLRKHQVHAARYSEAFSDLGTVRPLRHRLDRSSSCWLYTLRVQDLAGFRRAMERAGIVVSQVHARNDRHTVFQASRAPLPGVDEFTREQVSIPVGWWLSDDEVEHIIRTVRAFDASRTGAEA